MDPNKRLLAGIIIVMIVIIGGLAYTIYNFSQTPQAVSTTTTSTTPYTSTSIEQTTLTTQPPTTSYTTTGSPNTTTTELSPYMPTVIPSWKDVTAFMKYLHSKELQGYDVYLAEYLVLSAIYHYKMGDKSTALQLLKQAYKTVKETYRIGSVKLPEIKISDNALEYRRSPTTWDVAPIGTVFLISRYGYLVYPSGDNHWKLSCFIFMAMDNNDSFIYQGRLPLLPRETQWMGFYPKIYYDGEWHYLWKIRFVGPIFVEKGNGWIKLWERDLSGQYIEYLTYIETNHTWIHGIKNVKTGREPIHIVAWMYGAPLWLGQWNKTWVGHGAYPLGKGLDIWSGFWMPCKMKATINLNGETRVFQGYFIMDRASHRSLYIPSYQARGAPVEFTCMVGFTNILNFMIDTSNNPSPLKKIPMDHQMRINLPYEHMIIDTTNFTVSFKGSLQPTMIIVKASLPGGGKLFLRGTIITYYPTKWPVINGTWWNPAGEWCWGRAFIRWTGELVLANTTMIINGVGAGEFTRYSGSSTCPVTTNTTRCGCWG